MLFGRGTEDKDVIKVGKGVVCAQHDAVHEALESVAGIPHLVQGVLILESLIYSAFFTVNLIMLGNGLVSGRVTSLRQR